MYKLERILEKYYTAHQISKTVNLLDIADPGFNTNKINITQCICNILEPKTGWDRYVLTTTSKNDKCYFCCQQFAQMYSDFPVFKNPQSHCAECYKFLCAKYIEKNSKLKLTSKFIRKHQFKAHE